MKHSSGVVVWRRWNARGFRKTYASPVFVSVLFRAKPEAKTKQPKEPEPSAQTINVNKVYQVSLFVFFAENGAARVLRLNPASKKTNKEIKTKSWMVLKGEVQCPVKNPLLVHQPFHTWAVMRPVVNMRILIIDALHIFLCKNKSQSNSLDKNVLM